MEIITAKRDILRAVARAAAATDKRSTLPACKCVLLTTEDGAVRVVGTDLYLSTRDSAPADVVQSGSVGVPGQDLLDRLKAMPDGPVKLSEATSGSLVVASLSSKLRFSVSTIRPEEFPPLADEAKVEVTLRMPGGLLHNLIGKVRSTISPDDTRANLHSMLLEASNGDTLRAVATDGHRLIKAEVKVKSESDITALVPLRAVVELQRLAGDSDTAEVELRICAGSLSLVANGAVFTTKLVDASFPSYRQVMPKEGSDAHKVTVGRAALEAAVKAVSLASDSKSGGVRLKLADDLLTVTAESADSGDAHDEVPCHYHGEFLEIGLASKYLLEALAVVDEAEVAIWHGGGALDPLLWRPASAEMSAGLVGVLMPMRL